VRAGRPRLIVIAGPNGAGKTTVSSQILQGPLRVAEFVNADVIARGLSAFNPDATAISAGRILLTRLRELASQHVSFAFETTLASKSFAPWIGDLVRAGYEFHLLYFWLDSPDLAVRRVRDRVALGGHAVPEERIRRRYYAGLRNFFELYQPLAARWRLYDNSSRFYPRPVASGMGSTAVRISDLSTWVEIRRLAVHEGEKA